MAMSAQSDAGRGHITPQLGSDDASAPAGMHRWILNGWQDQVFFVATPLLIIPLIAILRVYLTVADIALYVVSFGALGHHLPGMLRAYGDRELFARFRVRFILAPLFLLAICGFFAHRNLNGLSVIVLLWGAWHGAAQVYGFLRIYDAKVKSFSPVTAKLDMAMCVAWFGLGMLQSPDEMNSIFRAFYNSGGPLIPAQMVHALQTTWTASTGAITAAFLANCAWQWRYGRPPSSAKLLMMISSFGFWWYAMISINNIILGVAMFEVFHDVQYLAIVWVYNVNRVQTGHRVGAFTRFLFRRSWFLAGLYVGLVFAYGYIGLFGKTVDIKHVKLALLSLITASTFLHFYYDGFIWKVREKATREGLGLSGGLSEQSDQPVLPGWLKHGLCWSLFVVPVAMFATAELRGVRPTLESEMAIVDAVPNSAIAHYKVAVPLLEAEKYDEALKHLNTAHAIQPDYPASFDDRGAKVNYNLGLSLQGLGRLGEAVDAYQNALRIAPDFADAHDRLGYVLQTFGRHQEASEQFRAVLRIKPDFADAHMSLGMSLFAMGYLDEAGAEFENALRIKPEYSEAQSNLGLLLHGMGRYEDAAAHYQEALRIAPDFANAHNNLARLLATCPNHQLRDAQRAVVHAKRAAELTGHGNPLVLDTLAVAYAEIGDLKQAINWQQKAVELAPTQEKHELQQRLDAYRSQKPVKE